MMHSSNDRLRILHVVLNLDEGGLERLVPDIAGRLDPHRFETHVLCLEYPGRQAGALDGVATLHQAHRLTKLSILRPSRLTEQVRAIAPDIVHTHSGVWNVASLAARRACVPWVIHTDHGRPFPDSWKVRLVERLAVRRTDIVVAVSDALARQLSRTIVQGRCRIQVVLNGVDTEAFRPRSDTGVIRTELGVSDDVPIIGSIGRLDPVKGYDVMIAAFARLLAGWPVERPSPLLVIAGDGPERVALRKLVEGERLGSTVRLLGWRDDIHDLHAAFTVFTLASHSEGTSVSLLEGMSAGLCPIVTDVGGNAAVLGEHLRHRLVTPGDPDALAQAWRLALEDSSRREADGRTARTHVLSSFSLRQMAAHYAQIYQDVHEARLA